MESDGEDIVFDGPDEMDVRVVSFVFQAFTEVHNFYFAQ